MTSKRSRTSRNVQDSKRTRRSQEQMPDVKKKKIQRLKNQKQYSKKGAGLSKYRGNSGENDENMPPSDDFLCSKTQKLKLEK